MRRLLISLPVFFLLAACSGGSGEEVSCNDYFWDGTIGYCIPDGWTLLDEQALAQRSLEVPEDMVASLQADEQVSGMYPIITLTREPLTSVTEPLAYSDASIRSVSILPGYTQVDAKEMSVAGDTVRLNVFTAQPMQDEPRLRFYQVSTVSEMNGYTLTAVTPVTVEEELEQQILAVLQSLTFSDPEN